MADVRSLWALRRATKAQRPSGNARNQSEVAIANARGARRMRVCLEELRQKRRADTVTARRGVFWPQH